ncbi:MAG: HDIG domain-containing protein [Clostridia bacterium]|nr:HDIG domain-containing protein [Deltaproteobacteria bacterium]
MTGVIVVLIAFALGAAIAWAAAKAGQSDLSGLRAKLVVEEELLAVREREARERLAKAQERLDELTRSLEAVAGLSQEEARAQLLMSVDEEVRERLRMQISGRLREEERRLETESRERAARVLADVMQRQARSYVTQGAVTQLHLPNDEIKGRIIGRDGRNARAFETATGTDLVIDESPNVVTVSAFNPFRRTVAATALERLITDGRIHPARIEEVVAETRKELEDSLVGRGESARAEAGISASLRPEVAALLGRLHFHDAGGQSMLAHAIETAQIAGALALELGVRVQTSERARRAGLLHDIGKAVTEPSSAHAEAGAKAAERHGEHPEVVAAIRTHHATEPEGLVGVLVQVANTLSKERLGARRGAIETISRRLADFEAAATAIEGVTKAFAIQAGAEVRVFVDPSSVEDAELEGVAQRVAAAVAKRNNGASAVAVTVIREARAIATARV